MTRTCPFKSPFGNNPHLYQDQTECNKSCQLWDEERQMCTFQIMAQLIAHPPYSFTIPDVDGLFPTAPMLEHGNLEYVGGTETGTTIKKRKMR